MKKNQKRQKTSTSVPEVPPTRATPSLLTLAWGLDGTLIISLWGLLAWIFDSHPLPGATSGLILVLIFLSLRLIYAKYKLTTPGEFALGVTIPEVEERFSIRSVFVRLQPCSFSKKRFLIQSICSVFAALSIVVVTLLILPLSNPLLITAERIELDAYDPGSRQSISYLVANAPTRWVSAPFFYAIGSLPIEFAGDVVLMRLPYRKGPPQKFLEEINFFWRFPDITLTLEGPKSPTSETIQNSSKEAVFECLSNNKLECRGLRESILKRHIYEMKKQIEAPRDWNLKWFRLKKQKNGEKNADNFENTEGFILRLENKNQTEIRSILITPNGRHQTLIFRAPKTKLGKQAEELFFKTLRTISLSLTLTSGRILSAHILSKIDLNKLDGLKNNFEYMLELARIHTILLSRASVNPKDVEPYFHLGGTALMGLKKWEKSEFEDKKQTAENTRFLMELINSSLKYVKDVKANAKRMVELEKIQFEARKILDETN